VEYNIKALIFDFGNVISLPQDNNTIAEMTGLLGVSFASFKKSYGKFRHEFDKGEISAAEYWEKILLDLDLKTDPDKINKLTRLDIKSWTFINSEILKFFDKIKNNYRLAILSNMPHEILYYIKENFSWLGVFDKTVFSCEYNICKPEKKIFELCISELKIEPQKCLFIDDMPDNINGAASLGLNTLQFTTFDSFKEQVKKFIS
jgi:putative hydrolase of the HAD superfamily